MALIGWTKLALFIIFSQLLRNMTVLSRRKIMILNYKFVRWEMSPQEDLISQVRQTSELSAKKLEDKFLKTFMDFGT